MFHGIVSRHIDDDLVVNLRISLESNNLKFNNPLGSVKQTIKGVLWGGGTVLLLPP